MSMGWLKHGWWQYNRRALVKDENKSEMSKHEENLNR